MAGPRSTGSHPESIPTSTHNAAAVARLRPGEPFDTVAEARPLAAATASDQRPIQGLRSAGRSRGPPRSPSSLRPSPGRPPGPESSRVTADQADADLAELASRRRASPMRWDVPPAERAATGPMTGQVGAAQVQHPGGSLWPRLVHRHRPSARSGQRQRRPWGFAPPFGYGDTDRECIRLRPMVIGCQARVKVTASRCAAPDPDRTATGCAGPVGRTGRYPRVGPQGVGGPGGFSTQPCSGPRRSGSGRLDGGGSVGVFRARCGHRLGDGE
jgi:hypothetical protein